MKSKLSWIAVIIVLLLAGFQFWITLNGHLALPSADWSRPESLSDLKSDYSTITSVKDENGYIVSLKDLKKQDIFFCNKELDSCSHERTNTNGVTYKNTYNDAQNSYYIHNDQLVRETDGKTSVIADALNFEIGEGKLVYWNEESEVVVMDLEKMEQERRDQLKEPVKMGRFVDGDLLIITEDAIKRNLTVYLMQEKPVLLFSFQIKASENLQSLQFFTEGKGRYGLLEDLEILAGGGRTKMLMYAAFDQSPAQKPLFKKLKFLDRESGNRLEDIRNPYVLNDNEGKKIAFSGSGFDSTGYSTKIYVGDFSDDVISAEPATKTGDSFSRPHLVDRDHVLFFAISGKEKSLSTSSADPKKVAESSEIREGDFKSALYKLLTILMNGLVLLLVSFIWFLPAFGVTYGLAYLFRRIHRPLTEQVLFILHVIVLLGMQILTFTKIYQMQSILHRIPFLSDSWQLIVLLMISLVISALPVLLVRKKVTEDNFNSSIMYVTFVNLLILLVVVGPYFL